MKKLKIISWNVNGLRAILKKGNLDQLIKDKKPDLIFLQEIKVSFDKLPVSFLNHDYYQFFFNSAKKKGYSGTSIGLRKGVISNFSFQRGMEGIDNKDEEGRVATLKVILNERIYFFICTYMPNGGKSQLAWKEKLIFYNNFLKYLNNLKRKNAKVIWGGDVNCAHQEIDLARPKENDGKIGFHPLERKALDKFVNYNWVDIWRKLNPQKKDVYSWWHLVTQARQRNVGWRIDYFFCQKQFFKNIINCTYLDAILGSDHCPIYLELEL